tara:strand:+ start:739 stop:1023 length:285 start_codon:yes stop_codon:yes gene_type:complete
MKKYVDGVLVDLTTEEITAKEAADKAWADGADARLAAEHRNTRNQLLADSDWTQMPDSPLSSDKKTEWATYRTALRDLPTNKNWPSVTFSTKPS